MWFKTLGGDRGTDCFEVFGGYFALEEGTQDIPGVVSKGEELPQCDSIAPHVRLIGELMGDLQTLWRKPGEQGYVKHHFVIATARERERGGGGG